MSTMHQTWTEVRERGEQRRRRMARRMPRWRTRPRRRILAGLWLLSPLTLIVLSMTLSWESLAQMSIYLVVLAVWYPFWLVLRVLTAASAEAVAAFLDEREKELRNRLNYVAFNVLIISNVLVVFYVIGHEEDPLVAVRTGLLLMSCTMLAASVPTALLAWIMPDDDPEDLEDPDLPAERTDNEGESLA